MNGPRPGLREIARFFRTDIWRMRMENLSPVKAFWIRMLRTAVLATRGFFRDDCMERASSLTFYSLLSVVPVVAMAFGVAKGFGFEKRLQRQILEQIPGQEEILIQVVETAQKFLESTKGGLIAGIGVVVLFWSVIKVLSHIEEAFNHIWRIEKSRTFGRKFADYLSIMLIGPVVMIMSSSLNVYITAQVTDITQKIELLDRFSPMIFFLLQFLPLALIWSLFTIMYLLMPNTRVRFVPGLLAGLVAGTVFQVAQGAYIEFQIGVARYNAIYGSFAALPLFLIWLQISWFIVLFGAEVSFAAQNQRRYEFYGEIKGMSLRFKQLLCLMAARWIVRRFTAGQPAATAGEISENLMLPTPLVGHLLETLVASGTISETADTGTLRYQPAVDTQLLTVHRVLSAIAKTGSEDIPVDPANGLKDLTDTLDRLNEAVEQSPANRLMRDL